MKLSDITVVFQGAIKPYVTREGVCFSDNVRMVKRVLPGARIVVSTWAGSEMPRGLHIDELVLNDDPGGLAPLKLGDDTGNNINRQLISTQSGLAAAATPYALKLRIDCTLEHAGFLDFYAEQIKRDGGRERLLACSFFTLDTDMFERMPYHLSDWVHFGPTALLQRYWAARPMAAPEARFYEHNTHAPHSTFFERKFLPRLAVEQHVCIQFAASLGYAVPHYLNDLSEAVLRDYARFLAREIMLLDPWQIGLVFNKYSWVGSSLFQRLNNLMHIDWLRISGQLQREAAPAPQLLALAAERARQKRLARLGFQASRPWHGYIFGALERGNALRFVAHRMLKHLA